MRVKSTNSKSSHDKPVPTALPVPAGADQPTAIGYHSSRFRRRLSDKATIVFAATRRNVDCMRGILTYVLCMALVVPPATAHRTSSETTGTETPDVPSVESCVTFAWTKKRRCSTYDTTHHDWEVVNNCPRAVKVTWADNAYDRPIERNDDSGKPRAENATDVQAGKTIERSVSCTDKAELEICIEYIYPPLKEHDDIDCDQFFH